MLITFSQLSDQESKGCVEEFKQEMCEKREEGGSVADIAHPLKGAGEWLFQGDAVVANKSCMLAKELSHNNNYGLLILNKI